MEKTTLGGYRGGSNDRLQFLGYKHVFRNREQRQRQGRRLHRSWKIMTTDLPLNHFSQKTRKDLNINVNGVRSSVSIQVPFDRTYY